MADGYNHMMTLGMPGPTVNLESTHDGAFAAGDYDDDNFMYVTRNPGRFGVGSRVLSTKNTWKPAGYVNRLKGVVLHIVYAVARDVSKVA